MSVTMGQSRKEASEPQQMIGSSSVPLWMALKGTDMSGTLGPNACKHMPAQPDLSEDDESQCALEDAMPQVNQIRVRVPRVTLGALKSMEGPILTQNRLFKRMLA